MDVLLALKILGWELACWEALCVVKNGHIYIYVHWALLNQNLFVRIKVLVDLICCGMRENGLKNMILTFKHEVNQ